MNKDERGCSYPSREWRNGYDVGYGTGYSEGYSEGYRNSEELERIAEAEEEGRRRADYGLVKFFSSALLGFVIGKNKYE